MATEQEMIKINYLMIKVTMNKHVVTPDQLCHLDFNKSDMYCNKVKTPLINLVCIWQCNRLNDPVTITVDPAQPKVRICYL